MIQKIQNYSDRTQYVLFPGNILHRDDGPAVIYKNGTEFWYDMGELHRLDGPAITWADDGTEWYGTEWYINGIHITGKIHKWAKEMGIDLNNLSEDDIVLISMKFS